MIQYLKAFHLIFVVTWFAGLFYIIRLFIYQTEAKEKSEEEQRILIPQFKIMSKRLWFGITWPSAILTLIFGLWLVYMQPALLKQYWLHWKFGLLIGLFAYHLFSHKIYKELMNDRYRWGSFRLRLWNELATVFLFGIIFTIMVFRYQGEPWVGVLGIFVIIGVLVGAVYLYKRARQRKEANASKE